MGGELSFIIKVDDNQGWGGKIIQQWENVEHFQLQQLPVGDKEKYKREKEDK